MYDIPPGLTLRPFTAAEAHAAGLSDRVLSGRRFIRLFPTVYAVRELELTQARLIDGASLALPNAFASHETGLQAHGVDVGLACPLHFSTDARDRARIQGVDLHRYDRLPAVQGRALIPEACWLGAALHLPQTALVVAGDSLLHHRLTTFERLWDFVDAAHGSHGVKKSREALTLVREHVESPRETIVRLILSRAGLPEPECNLNIDDNGRFLGRADLAYRDYKVIVEYDGRQHLTDHRQWERDVGRHQDFADAGWIVIRVTNDQLRHPDRIVARVRAALNSRGYRG